MNTRYALTLLALPLALMAEADNKNTSTPVHSIPSSYEYELRGIFGKGKNAKVSLARKGEETSTWLGVGEKQGLLTIKSINAEQSYTVITINEKLYKISLATQRSTEVEESEELNDGDEKYDSIEDEFNSKYYDLQRKFEKLISKEDALKLAWQEVVKDYPKAQYYLEHWEYLKGKPDQLQECLNRTIIENYLENERKGVQQKSFITEIWEIKEKYYLEKIKSLGATDNDIHEYINLRDINNKSTDEASEKFGFATKNHDLEKEYEMKKKLIEQRYVDYKTISNHIDNM